jgi:hypothetical protein
MEFGYLEKNDILYEQSKQLLILSSKLKPFLKNFDNNWIMAISGNVRSHNIKARL